MRFDDEPIDDDRDDGLEQEQTQRVEMHQAESGIDVTDFPQNPYGDRETKNTSLFFADGERSVDFVLVWKKLLPHDDDERSDVLKQRDIDDVVKKETERIEKRDYFEENLILEGLEIERETVDEEINFVKIHAPLEVLRRYAEILKLRLAMKEVSNNSNDELEDVTRKLAPNCDVFVLHSFILEQNSCFVHHTQTHAEFFGCSWSVSRMWWLSESSYEILIIDEQRPLLLYLHFYLLFIINFPSKFSSRYARNRN